MIEEWKASPLEGYLVSSWGRIMREPYQKRGRTYGGHAWYGVLKKGNRYEFQYRGKNYKVHRLVCEAFNGPPPFEGAVVMHEDEDGSNNRPENLKWGTQKENLNYPGYLTYCKSRVGEQNPRKKGINWRKQLTL